MQIKNQKEQQDDKKSVILEFTTRQSFFVHYVQHFLKFVTCIIISVLCLSDCRSLKFYSP